jgi:hypothetical protein
VKQRFGLVLAVLALALVGTGSALAFDCIRVSSSLTGLQQSTKSGHWALFNLSSGAALQQSLAALGEAITSEQADCASDAYKAAGEDLPLYFALGLGVAGPNGVLAHNNPNDESVLANLRGIDHLEDSPIGAALFGAAEGCGIPVDDE